MLNRIYTRSEEAIWKQKGLLRVPKSYRQEALAIASKEYIESLRCYSEVRRLLAAGKKPRDVAIFIQQHNEYQIIKFWCDQKICSGVCAFFHSAIGNSSKSGGRAASRAIDDCETSIRR